ncbi:ribosome maturation factor RimP [Selenomonas sp. WCA-380-WT-3B 3/]|uniref:Ribosome maturation factor RimP n=1 Tax=Selenomonas montiformis TaxID=2652285 RepID=A0A6I2UVM2_9FIRM|nr:ribosome maturation factor RimP [Selenomonas montiformis]MSV24405.1 ribosome maturation factor RimP [Selenomonas montiformis]
MAAKDIEQAVEALVSDLLSGQDAVELVDVEYTKEHDDWYLRVYIDKDGGIDIEDCQKLSERLEEKLDEGDSVPGSYILEVSSPGIDRVLRKPRDLIREQGKAVDVSLYAPWDGKKLLSGVLTGFDGQTITLDENINISMDKVAQIRLHIDF